MSTQLCRAATTVAFVLVLAACGSSASVDAQASTETQDPVKATTTELVSAAPTGVEQAVEGEPVVVVSTTVPVEEEPVEEERAEEEPVEGQPFEELAAVDPVFESVLEDLTAGTDLPLRLPTDLGSDLGAGTEVFATLAAAEPGFYHVALGLAPDCTGNACTFGSLTARRLDAGDDPLDGGVAVPLPDGGTGEFYDLTCGASCGEAFISWTEGDVQYTVGSKSSVEDVLDLAWSALSADAAPEAPQNCDGGIELEDDTSAAIIQDDSFPGFYWYILCRQNDTYAQVVTGPAALRSLEPGVSELVAVEFPDGTTQLFRGLTPFTNVDYQAEPSTHRMVIGDLRCGSTGEKGDGIIDIVADAENYGVFEALERLGTPIIHEGAIEIEALTDC